MMMAMMSGDRTIYRLLEFVRCLIVRGMLLLMIVAEHFLEYEVAPLL